jgi:hypothetical protein
MQHPMLIMVLVVLTIGFWQNIMDLLVDVIRLLNESGGIFSLRLNMKEFFCVVARGSETSMGPKGWNPIPT